MRPLHSTLDLLGFACIGRIRRIRRIRRVGRIPWDSAPPVGSPVSPHASAKTLRFGWIWSDFLGFTRICLDLVELPGAVQFPRLTSRPNQNTAVWSDLVGFPWIWSNCTGRAVPSSHPTPPPKYCRLVGFGRIWLDLPGFAWIWSNRPGLSSSFVAPHASTKILRFGRIWSDFPGFGRIATSRAVPSSHPRLHQNTAVWSDLVGFGWISLDSSFAANEETDDERQRA